jgi:hypothetical protein
MERKSQEWKRASGAYFTNEMGRKFQEWRRTSGIIKPTLFLLY